MWITGAELARAAGLTPQSIFNLERNELVVCRQGKRGKKEYDVDSSIARILGDPKTRKKESVREAYGGWCKTRGRQPYWMTQPADDGGGAEDPEDSDTWSLNEAKRRKEIYAAKLEKIKFEKESGKYIEADAARAAMEDIGIRTQKAFMSMADRISAMVAAEQSPFECQQIIDREVRAALQSLAADLTKAAPA